VVTCGSACRLGSHRLWRQLSAFGGLSVYRNGYAANIGVDSLFSPSVARGYWLNAGLEWKLGRDLALNGVFTRLTQLGTPALNVGDFTRNVFAVRLVYAAF